MRAFRWLVVVLGIAALGGTAEAQPQRSEAAAQAPRPKGQAQPPSGQAPEMRIAAVVNDEVISILDLFSRMQLVMIASNIPDTPETRQRLATQVLRSLIDERLQLQEAKRQNVTATESEVKNAMGQVEKQNNMRTGQLEEFLKARGIDRGSLSSQITASIVWAKLVKKQAAQTVEITDEEIDEALNRAKEHAKEPQSRVAEIFLSVDKPAQDDEVRRTAERLTQQMKQGARFSAVARQFSQSATAAVGGDMGWMRPDQLPPELAKRVAQLRPGELSPPIAHGGGYYLMLVLDRRAGSGGGGGEQETVFDIVQVVFPLPPKAGDAARQTALQQVESVRGQAKDCPTLLKIGKERAPELSSEGKLRANSVSAELRKLISGLPVGQVSPPIVQRNGVGVIMVCGKSAGGGSETSRQDITESLIRQRLDNVAKRYLRDLRRNSYVDVRV
jgi:peptidyl-prolyl cis-trans isomerase SurA